MENGRWPGLWWSCPPNPTAPGSKLLSLMWVALIFYQGQASYCSSSIYYRKVALLFFSCSLKN